MAQGPPVYNAATLGRMVTAFEHVAAARAAAGTEWAGVFENTCRGAVALANPPAARGGGAGRAAGGGGAGRAAGDGGAGRAGGPAAPPDRETWYAEPEKGFHTLYFPGQKDISVR